MTQVTHIRFRMLRNGRRGERCAQPDAGIRYPGLV